MIGQKMIARQLVRAKIFCLHSLRMVALVDDTMGVSSHIQLSLTLRAIVDATLTRAMQNALAGRDLQYGANPQAVCQALDIAYESQAHTIKFSKPLAKQHHEYDDDILSQSDARQQRRLSKRERERQDYHLHRS